MWKETDVLDQRLRFIAAFQARPWTMMELCRAFGHPNQTIEAVESLIVAARKRHPSWGATKLIAWLS